MTTLSGTRLATVVTAYVTIKVRSAEQQARPVLSESHLSLTDEVVDPMRPASQMIGCLLNINPGLVERLIGRGYEFGNALRNRLDELLRR